MPRPSRAVAAIALALSLAATLEAGSFTPTTTPALNGVRAIVDLPASQHMRNTGGMGRRGPGTGAGLCVFTSCEINAHWLRVLELNGFQKWMTTKAGGGSPPKLDAMIRQFCSEKGIPVPLYVQHTGGDDSFLDACFKNGRGCCVTYAGMDDFYKGPIAHMVYLAHLDATTAAIIDNNRPGNWIWMSRTDFLKRWRGNGGGWAVCFMAPPPPPYESAPSVQSLPEHRWEELPPYEPDDAGDVVGSESASDSFVCWVRVDFPDGPLAVSRSLLVPLPCQKNEFIAEWQKVASGACVFTSADDKPSPLKSRLQWKKYPESPEKWFLFADGQLIGMYDAAGWHVSEDGKRYAVKAKGRPPIHVPGELVEEAPPPRLVTNFGLITEEVHQFKAYWISGTRTTRADVEAALKGDTLADDSNKFNLSVVGTKDFQSRFKADWSKVDAKFTSRVNVTYFDPDNWQVSQFTLPLGVQLRRPASNTPAGRVGSSLGVVPQDVYDLMKLLELLGLMDGPKPTPLPAPSPTPVPGPSPAPDNPNPQPAAPVTIPNWLLAIGGLLLLMKLKGKK